MRPLFPFGARPCLWKGLSKRWWDGPMNGWMRILNPITKGELTRSGRVTSLWALHQGACWHMLWLYPPAEGHRHRGFVPRRLAQVLA